jgi:hypothetical protein
MPPETASGLRSRSCRSLLIHQRPHSTRSLFTISVDLRAKARSTRNTADSKGPCTKIGRVCSEKRKGDADAARGQMAIYVPFSRSLLSIPECATQMRGAEASASQGFLCHEIPSPPRCRRLRFRKPADRHIGDERQQSW